MSSLSDHRPLLKTRLSSALRTTSAHVNALGEVGVVTINDFFHYFPRTYRDRTERLLIADLRTDQIGVVEGVLGMLTTMRTKTGKWMTRGTLQDESGVLHLMWFNQPHIQRLFRKGDSILVTGKPRFQHGKLFMMSPQCEPLRNKPIHTGRLVPVYHEHGCVTSKWIREKIQPLLKGTRLLEDHLPETLLKAEGLMAYGEAVRLVHDPKSDEELFRARERLAFDELLLLQLGALQRRWRLRQSSRHDGRVVSIDPALTERFSSALSFQLTGAQHRVVGEIFKDLNSPYPMMRLLQGDVGSGKTVVSAFGIVQALGSGFQAALMAPTEILARQHYKSLMRFLGEFGFNIQLLVGSLPASQKEAIALQIATGTVDLVVGTHALIQEGVTFARLGFAVIDEQHRFGVKQRDLLAANGAPHVLNLSATPIPRTLAMVVYGDQDVSILDELPPGRQEIITRLVPEKKRRDAELWIADQIHKGRQVFVVCPLIDESDVLGVKAVTTEYERLQGEVFKEFKIGLLHGKLPPAEKEDMMSRFGAGELDILVSTSVIEVGIDVPNATIMLIEGAERFGLSQLHQFRGRVGRGEYQSYCFLFTDSDSEESRQRLNALVQHSSGFRLAEIDLALRGPGEVYGVRQSGIPDLKMASLGDAELVSRVRRAAVELVAQDPELERHPALRAKIEEISTF